MAENTHDAIVIGTGQGGKPLARALATAGRKTAVIERSHVGGTCVNHGCTPTKTMVASARVSWLCERAADYGVTTGPVEVDMRSVRERKRSIVERFRSGSEKSLMNGENIDFIRGEASFAGPKTVRVETAEGEARELSADLVFINTGLRPIVPPIEGLDGVPTLDNASIMELDSVPEHLLALGGGYIGVEFAQMFSRFGSEVTLIDRAEHILAEEDADVAEEVTQMFRDDGIRVLAETGVRRARQEDGVIHLGVEGPQGQQTVSGSHLLLAAGRAPSTEALDLGAAGIETDDEGFICVDERLETSVPGVYALGDVKGGPAFTHVSYNDFMVLKTNLLDGGDATTRGRPLLYTVFIDPQLGRIGLNESQAREEGRSVRVARLPMSQVARALETDETIGMMKALVDPRTDQILGATIFGMQGGELMSMLQIAMMGGVTYPQLRDGMFAHPLLAESFNSLFASFDSE